MTKSPIRSTTCFNWVCALAPFCYPRGAHCTKPERAPAFSNASIRDRRMHTIPLGTVDGLRNRSAARVDGGAVAASGLVAAGGATGVECHGLYGNDKSRKGQDADAHGGAERQSHSADRGQLRAGCIATGCDGRCWTRRPGRAGCTCATSCSAQCSVTRTGGLRSRCRSGRCKSKLLKQQGLQGVNPHVTDTALWSVQGLGVHLYAGSLDFYQRTDHDRSGFLFLLSFLTVEKRPLPSSPCLIFALTTWTTSCRTQSFFWVGALVLAASNCSNVL